MSKKALSYSQSGVNIERGDRFVSVISPLAKKTHHKEVLSSLGGFASLSWVPKHLKQPVLVSSTDGVGTKVLLAREYGKFDTVGIDLVAMCVNDILTLGAQPSVFLDYFATSRLNISVGKELLRGIVEGCKQAHCALVGGETAEMPQVYKKGDFDLAGFSVGFVEAKKIIDGRKVRLGDVVVGFPSNGIHSNGFSLVRAIVRKKKLSLWSSPPFLKGKKLGEELLRPTTIYVPVIESLLTRMTPHAMAHITGSGLEGNIPRVLPQHMNVELNSQAWEVPAIFTFLQEKGKISIHEMFRTFNMGIGFVVVVSPKDANVVLQNSPKAIPLGRIIPGKGEPRLVWK